MVVLGAESHDRGLDGVVNADVETGVRSVAQDGGDESGEQSALVDSQDVPASVEDGVIRHLVELHSRLHKGDRKHNRRTDRTRAETGAQGIERLVVDVPDGQTILFSTACRSSHLGETDGEGSSRAQHQT